MSCNICDCTSGSCVSPLPKSFEALSNISRAVTLLPRASLGSDTLNIPVMKSVIRVARSRSWLARSRSCFAQLQRLHPGKHRKHHQQDSAHTHCHLVPPNILTQAVAGGGRPRHYWLMIQITLQVCRQ